MIFEVRESRHRQVPSLFVQLSRRLHASLSAYPPSYKYPVDASVSSTAGVSGVGMQRPLPRPLSLWLRLCRLGERSDLLLRAFWDLGAAFFFAVDMAFSYSGQG